MNQTITIDAERPDTADALELIAELEDALDQYHYPAQSKHGYSVEKLLREGVAFFVTRIDGQAAGCGGIQIYPQYGEVKRMFVRPSFRGLGLARKMLDCLCAHARQREVYVLRLETGIHQLDAVRLYEGYGFQVCPPFGEYVLDPLSVYYELHLA